MRIAPCHLAGIVAVGLLGALPARSALTGASFNFDSNATGNLAGQSGWDSVGFGGAGGVQVAVGGGGTTVNFASFNGTSGTSASAWNVGAFGSLTGSESFNLQFDFLAGDSPAAIVGLGWDNGTGQVSFGGSSSLLGLSITATRTSLEVAVNGNSLHADAQSYAQGTWRTIQARVDLSANGGAGTVSLYGKGASSSSLSPLTGFQNIGLSLNRSGTDASDPTLWNTLWIHEAGPGAGLDNIIVVPEPESWTLVLAGVGAMVWVIRRQR